jgi:hypothetical protein
MRGGRRGKKLLALIERGKVARAQVLANVVRHLGGRGS